jgi:hypothetical protein
MIKWEPITERHVRGSCNRGVVWIRLNRENRVSGVYFIFSGQEKEKWVPRVEQEETLAYAKSWAEDQLQLIRWSEELEIKNEKR